VNYSLSLKARTDLSHWELSHIINVFGNTYMKLMMIQEMQKLYNAGATDSDFIIGSQSLELHVNIHELDTAIQIPNIDEYTIQDRKSENADSFWKLFHKLHRPIIFYKTSHGYKSLYNFENSFIIKGIETNSPQSFKLNGKEIIFNLAIMILSPIIGHPVQELVYGNSNAQIERQLQRILTNQENAEEERRELRNQMIILERDNKALIQKLDQTFQNENIDYYEFLKAQQKIIEERFNQQIIKTPMIVEDFTNE